MSVIFPGNYVAHLNAYRDQGVFALPGVEFYQVVGAAIVDSNIASSGTLTPQVQSPDLRQDDKPRTDKAFVIPKNSVVYRTALNAPGVKATASGNTIKIVALGGNAPGDTGSEVTLTAAADKFFPADGAASAMLGIVNGTAISTSADTTVQVITSANCTAEQNPSVGADRKSPSAILVEICYYRPAPAPDASDAHIPYGIEAGQGT